MTLTRFYYTKSPVNNGSEEQKNQILLKNLEPFWVDLGHPKLDSFFVVFFTTGVKL